MRLKSFDDLHKLWFICLKERNFLLSERLYYRQIGQSASDPVRLQKVKKTMAAIKVVIGERARASALLEAETERTAHVNKVGPKLASFLTGGLVGPEPVTTAVPNATASASAGSAAPSNAASSNSSDSNTKDGKPVSLASAKTAAASGVASRLRSKVRIHGTEDAALIQQHWCVVMALCPCLPLDLHSRFVPDSLQVTVTFKKFGRKYELKSDHPIAAKHFETSPDGLSARVIKPTRQMAKVKAQQNEYFARMQRMQNAPLTLPKESADYLFAVKGKLPKQRTRTGPASSAPIPRPSASAAAAPAATA